MVIEIWYEMIIIIFINAYVHSFENVLLLYKISEKIETIHFDYYTYISDNEKTSNTQECIFVNV